MVKLNRTKAMLVLLNAIKISTAEYVIKDDSIELNINSQQLFYRIGTAGDAVQHVYGKTEEWKELMDAFKLTMLK